MTSTEKYNIPLRLINSYLHRETHYGPLASAMDGVRYIEEMLRGTPDYAAFADFMKRLATELYGADDTKWVTDWRDADNTLPWVADDSEQSYDRVMFNNLVIETACFYGVQKCLDEATRRFGVWRALTVDEAGYGFSPE